MSDLSTDDCKKFLISIYPETKTKEWKRVSKYKNDAGVWCREFNHPTLGELLIYEINGELSLKETDNVIETPVLKENTIVVQLFSKKDTSDAKRLVTRYLDDNWPSSDDKGYNAIPSQVGYMFSMLDEENEARMKEINEHEDYNSTMTACVLDIRPLSYPESDYEMSGLIEDFLPDSSMGEAMECTFEFEFDEPISIKDFVQEMANKGFVYEPGIDFDGQPACFLYETIKKLEFVYQSTPVTKKVKKIAHDFKDEFIALVQNDDDVGIKRLLDNNMPLKMMINRISIHSYCLLNDAPKCFKLLVDSTPDMAIGIDNAANTIWKDMFTFSHQPSGFNYIEYLFEHSKYDFKDKSYGANIDFILNIMRNEHIFAAYKDKPHEAYLAMTCLAQCITTEDNYAVPYMKEQADKALEKYAGFVACDQQLTYVISNEAIIEPILDKMILLNNRIAGSNLKDYLVTCVQSFKKSMTALNEFDMNERIQRYERAIRKIDGI